MRRLCCRMGALAWLALTLTACTQVLGDFTESSTGSGATSVSNGACDDCWNRATEGACSGPVNACKNNPACATIAGCVGSCAINDTSCQQDCLAQSPDGVNDFDLLLKCLCHACPSCGCQ